MTHRGWRPRPDRVGPANRADIARWAAVQRYLAQRGPCPAGGEHTWAEQEEPGTGWACDECHAPMPERAS